jgi:DNA-binding NtrC family response regulator
MSRPLPLRLLIVDSDPGVRTIGMAVASSLAFEPAEASTGHAALAHFSKAQPDLIQLDPQLPDMFGYALLSHWRTAASRIQVAIVTADGSFDSVVQAMRLGACDYLPKPFESAQLRLMLQRMQQRLSSRSVSANPLQPSAVSDSISAKDVTRLSEIERATIERVFHQVNGDKIMAGKLLGISRATLYRKLKRYQIGIRSNSPRQEEAHA